MQPRRAVLASLAVAVVAAGSFLAASPAVAGGVATVDRISGADRYATSVELSKSEFTYHAPACFIATGTNYPDALAAGAAAAREGGPLLLTDPSSLPTVVKNELTRLACPNIFVVGGTSAVSANVVTQIHAALPGATIHRIAGTDRYDTGRQVVENSFPVADTVFVATGQNFPDALSAAAAAGAKRVPVILVNGSLSTIDTPTKNLIESLGATSIQVIGGTSAVSSGIKTALAALPGSPTVTRVSGSDRYETSVQIADHNFTNAASAYLATGSGFADALAGSTIAGILQVPLFTVESNCVPQATLDEINDLGVSTVHLIGGTSTLTANVKSLTSCTPHSI